MNPDGVREMLLNNFQGVRIDGTNATIIGSKEGTFIADRNQITRVDGSRGLAVCDDKALYRPDRRSCGSGGRDPIF